MIRRFINFIKNIGRKKNTNSPLKVVSGLDWDGDVFYIAAGDKLLPVVVDISTRTILFADEEPHFGGVK